MSDFNFSTPLRGRNVYVFCGPEWMEASADVTINWTLDVDARAYGIKSFSVNVTKVEAFLQLTDEQDQVHDMAISTPSTAPEPPTEGDTRAELLHYGRPEDFQVKVEFDMNTDSPEDCLPPLVPRRVEINLSRRIFEISF